MIHSRDQLAIEKSVQVVVIDFTQLQKVFASFWAGIYLEIDDNISKGRFK